MEFIRNIQKWGNIYEFPANYHELSWSQCSTVLTFLHYTAITCNFCTWLHRDPSPNCWQWMKFESLWLPVSNFHLCWLKHVLIAAPGMIRRKVCVPCAILTLMFWLWFWLVRAAGTVPGIAWRWIKVMHNTPKNGMAEKIRTNSAGPVLQCWPMPTFSYSWWLFCIFETPKARHPGYWLLRFCPQSSSLAQSLQMKFNHPTFFQRCSS